VTDDEIVQKLIGGDELPAIIFSERERLGNGEIVLKRTKHKCDQPYPWTSGLEDGSVWRCDCGRRWMMRRAWGDAFRWNRRYWPWPR
jgi:hypothetical protein